MFYIGDNLTIKFDWYRPGHGWSRCGREHPRRVVAHHLGRGPGAAGRGLGDRRPVLALTNQRHELREVVLGSDL